MWILPIGFHVCDLTLPSMVRSVVIVCYYIDSGSSLRFSITRFQHSLRLLAFIDDIRGWILSAQCMCSPLKAYWMCARIKSRTYARKSWVGNFWTTGCWLSSAPCEFWFKKELRYTSIIFTFFSRQYCNALQHKVRWRGCRSSAVLPQSQRSKEDADSCYSRRSFDWDLCEAGGLLVVLPPVRPALERIYRCLYNYDQEALRKSHNTYKLSFDDF